MPSLIFFLIFLCCESLHLQAEELRVGKEEKYETISTALIAARVGDRIVVKPGVYKETLVWPNTHGIVLFAEKGPEATTLSGDKKSPVIQMNGKLKWDTVIDGFTITDGGSGHERGQFGAGVNLIGASPTIRNCRISGNEARPYRGSGGIFLWNSRAIIEHNEIIQNRYQAERLHGGGICVWNGMPKIQKNIIESNAGDDERYFARGAGARLRESNALLTENLIRKNLSASVGAALYCEQNDKSCVFGNVIEENKNLGGASGAIFVEPNSDSQIGGDTPNEPNTIQNNFHDWKYKKEGETEKIRNLASQGRGRLNESIRANYWGGTDEETLSRQLEKIEPRPKIADKQTAILDAGIQRNVGH